MKDKIYDILIDCVVQSKSIDMFPIEQAVLRLETLIDQAKASTRENTLKEVSELIFHSLIRSQMENEAKYGDGTGKQQADYEKVINLVLGKYAPKQKEVGP